MSISKVKILPSQEYLQSILDYNAKTGDLTWKEREGNKKFNSRYAGTAAGYLHSNGYICLNLNKQFTLAHRLVWKLVTGKEPEGVIDHINRVRTDNRFENLRDISISENQHNTESNNKFGCKGICQSGSKYRATIKRYGKSIELGSFSSLEDAIAARKEAELKDWSHLKSNDCKSDFKLTYDYLNECMIYDDVKGILIWKARPLTHFKSNLYCKAWNTRYSNKPIINESKSGYITVGINSKNFLAHRLIYMLCNKLDHIPENMIIDHVNGLKSDNRIENLRLCTVKQNSYNMKISKSSTTGIKGVRFLKNKNSYVAVICINGKNKFLKQSKDINVCIDARKQAEELYHGTFARNA